MGVQNIIMEIALNRAKWKKMIYVVAPKIFWDKGVFK